MDVDKIKQLKHIGLRYFATDAEKRVAEETGHTKFPHLRPDSVYVIAIGTNWEPGCWQHVIDMVSHTNESDVCCWFDEIPDNMATIPYSNLNPMRDAACLYAHSLGFEWVMLIENDALPEPDMLLRLLKWNMPVIVPYIEDKVIGQSIAAPVYERGIGLQPVQWSALTCVLIWCKVLNCFPDCSPFHDVVTESRFFNKLIHFGHRVYQDTDTNMKIAKRPCYAGGLSSLNKLWKFWEQTDKSRRREPDRRPIDPNSPNQIGDIYLPSRVLVEEQ